MRGRCLQTAGRTERKNDKRMNYRLSRIAAICGGKFSGCDSEVRSVVTDSRSLSCELGCRPMFVAMRGANHDSHDFIAGMQSRGVRAFLVERGVEASSCTGECGFVQVDNAIEALQRLAAYHRAQFRGTGVGITGSNGKTVIKEWIAEELPAGMKCYRSPKSYNSQLGVPLSVLMLEGDEELAIFEAGISKPGEMERLERIIRPDAVIFTSIGDAHQENFINLEQKCDEKMILARSASKIIYHSYYEPLGRMVAAHFADRRPVDAASYPEVPESVIGNAASRRNAQIVEAFCDAMRYPAPSFAGAPSVAMRLEVKEGINDSILINDAYNLDLNSLALALDYLHSVALSRRRTLVLSDISQSGLSDDELYGRVAGMVARAGIDFLIGIGPRLKRYAALFACDKEFFTATDECVARINRDAVAGRAILLKGARDFRFEKLVHLLSRKSHTTVLEVDLDAMIHNLNYFRSKLSFGTRLVAMVKAGSYGAGDFEVAASGRGLSRRGVRRRGRTAARAGDFDADRGAQRRRRQLRRDDRQPARTRNLQFPLARRFRRRRDARGRNPLSDSCQVGYGFVEQEIAQLCATLAATPQVKAASVFSHLNCADMPEEDAYTRAQIALYDRMSAQLAASLPYPVIRHAANSAAIERFPEAQFDMCRLGLGLYGFGHNDALRPVSTLKTRIVQIKRLPAGDAVGYGRAGKLTRPTTTATIPIGYADGLDRHLGCGRWSVLVAGQPAPIIGRVCMDSCMIDITDIPGVKEGDEVSVFSPVPGNDLETMARVLDTISYEIMTSVSGRVKRIYLKE
mgnify:CR=1 FL=1